MRRAEFEQARAGLLEECRKVNDAKGADYAGHEDALGNFKRGAERFGMTPVQVWGVYAFKHFDAIGTFVRDGQVESEPIAGRVVDAINYLVLLHALVSEEES